MKKIFFLIGIISSLMLCNAQEQQVTANDSLAIDTISQPSNESQTMEEPIDFIESQSKSENLGTILGISLGALALILCGFIVYISIHFYYKRKMGKYKLIEKAIEEGRELPADFFTKVQKDNFNILEEGIICLSVGIGLLLCAIIFAPKHFLMAAGIIISLLGAGMIIIAIIRKKNKETAKSAENKTDEE